MFTTTRKCDRALFLTCLVFLELLSINWWKLHNIIYLETLLWNKWMVSYVYCVIMYDKHLNNINKNYFIYNVRVLRFNSINKLYSLHVYRSFNIDLIWICKWQIYNYLKKNKTETHKNSSTNPYFKLRPVRRGILIHRICLSHHLFQCIIWNDSNDFFITTSLYLPQRIDQRRYLILPVKWPGLQTV